MWIHEFAREIRTPMGALVHPLLDKGMWLRLKGALLVLIRCVVWLVCSGGGTLKVPATGSDYAC